MPGRLYTLSASGLSNLDRFFIGGSTKLLRVISVECHIGTRAGTANEDFGSITFEEYIGGSLGAGAPSTVFPIESGVAAKSFTAQFTGTLSGGTGPSQIWRKYFNIRGGRCAWGAPHRPLAVISPGNWLVVTFGNLGGTTPTWRSTTVIEERG